MFVKKIKLVLREDFYSLDFLEVVVDLCQTKLAKFHTTLD